MKKTLLFLIVVFMTISVSGRASGLQNRMNTIEETYGNEQLQDFNDISRFEKRLPLLTGLPLKSQKGIKYQLDSIIARSLDYLSMELVIDQKSEYTFDSEGNQTEEILYEWDKDINHWVPERREETSWDNDGNITEVIFYEWNTYHQDWQPDEKQDYTYDGQGNLIELIEYRIDEYDWDTGDATWVFDWKEEYTYDAEGNLIEAITYDYFDDEWEPYSKDELTYENGNMTEGTFYSWDEDAKDWEIDVIFEATYDENDLLVEVIHFRYDEDENDFVPSTKWEHSYDDNRNHIEEVIYYYVPDNEEWEPMNKRENEFDTDIAIEETAVPYEFLFFQLTNMITGINSFFYENEEWYLWQELSFYYSDYDPDPDPDPDTYTLTINIEGDGTVEVDGDPYTEPITVDKGTELALEAIPDEGYEFVEWTGDLQLPEAEVTITMDEDKNITAIFSQVDAEQYTLTLTIEGEGTVEVDDDPYTEPITVDEGTELALKAIPDEGYEFVEWTGDLQSTEAEETITMDEDKNITATFSVVNISGLVDHNKPAIFPNPFRDNITISNAREVTRVTITNMIGQTVKEFNLSGSETQIISAAELDDGMYLFIFHTENGDRMIKKMIKH